MKLLPQAWLAILVVVAVAAAGVGTWAAVERLSQGSSAPVPACSPAPPADLYSAIPVPARQFVSNGVIENGGSGAGSESRISVWSTSTSLYYLYIMDANQYSELGWTSNASGNASHSTRSGPATSYTWGSGPVSSANATVLVGGGDWYIIVFNPGSSTENVEVATGDCNPPEPPPAPFLG